MINKIIYNEIPSDNLILNINEVAARLNINTDYSSKLIKLCEERLRQEIKCAYTAVLTNVKYLDNNKLDLGFGSINSKSLYQNLKGANKAYIFVVTIGYGVDMLINKLAVTSITEHFITDSLASAFAETACDCVEADIVNKKNCSPRFSPGYGDLPLEIQPEILKLSFADKYLNISLNQSLLMTPSKTITAIIGVVE